MIVRMTRKILIAENRRLQDQLDATGHESRKVRAARLKDLEAVNEQLRASIEQLRASIDQLRAAAERT